MINFGAVSCKNYILKRYFDESRMVCMIILIDIFVVQNTRKNRNM